MALARVRASRAEKLNLRMARAPSRARLNRPRRVGGTREQAAKILQKTRPMTAVQARMEAMIAAMGAEEVGIQTAHRGQIIKYFQKLGFSAWQGQVENPNFVKSPLS